MFRRYAGAGNLLYSEQAFDVFAALITIGLIALVYGGFSGSLRIAMTLAFAFFVPGRAIVSNWPRLARWSATAMPMVLSLAVLGLLATVTLWAHVWHPYQLFELEAFVSLAGLAMGIMRRYSAVHSAPAEGQDSSQELANE